MTRLSASFFAFIIASQAAAQEGGWTYSATLYGWLADTAVGADTPVGPVEGELSFDEALDALDFAFMGAFEARNGRWGLIADVIFLDLSDDEATSGPAFTEATLEAQTTIATAYLAYRVAETTTSSVDLAVGLRGYWTESDLFLSAAAAPSQSLAVSDDWVDPLVAVRFVREFADKWYATLLLDAGGFGTGSEFTWQGLGTVGYRFNESWSMQAGYRYLESNRIENDGSVDLQISGPVIGASYRF